MAAVADGVLYFGSRDGHFYAVDAQSGQERWKFQAGSLILSRPAVADGVVSFADNRYLYAVDVQSGEERWRFQAGEEFRYGGAGGTPIVALTGGTTPGDLRRTGLLRQQ